MIHYKTNEEIEKLKQSCKIVNDSIAHAASFLKPGISTLELNDIAEEFILAHGAVPNFKNYHGYPYACCISVNDAVVHGFTHTNPAVKLARNVALVAFDKLPNIKPLVATYAMGLKS